MSTCQFAFTVSSATPLPLHTPDDAAPCTWVVCLCADWCDLCGDYRAVFQQVAGQAGGLSRHFPGTRFAWLDIEDQADWVGDLDIETFPTLLVADRHGVLFLGPLTPQAPTLSRLLGALQAPGAHKAAHTAVTARLVAALPDLPEHWL